MNTITAYAVFAPGYGTMQGVFAATSPDGALRAHLADIGCGDATLEQLSWSGDDHDFVVVPVSSCSSFDHEDVNAQPEYRARDAFYYLAELGL